MTRPKKQSDERKTRIAAVRHKDKRKNIPTEELSGFMTPEQKAEPKVLYPRDPDLDPQLVWKGKDQQDAAPLEGQGPAGRRAAGSAGRADLHPGEGPPPGHHRGF
jgi:hypothetical protein